MTKKKLMVVVGAGASIDFGMPSVNGVDTLFCTWAKENYRLACNENDSLYSYVRNAIESYYRLKEKRFEACTNFEEVLYVLLQLSKMVTNSDSSFPINAFLEMKSFPQIIHDNRVTTVDGSHFSELASYLVDKLLEDFRSRCGAIDLRSKEFQRFSGFIDRLNNDFNTVFISVNYDNLITKACQGLFTGFNEDGVFDASAFYSHRPFDRSPCGSIYHLHGSVHFDMVATDRDLHEVTWNNDLKIVSQNSVGRSRREPTGGISILTSSIIAGYGKSEQIQRVPLRNYYSVLDQVALDADAFLFLGYGFADQHLNNAFYPVSSSEKPVVVIDHADIGQNTLSLGRQDAWSRNLLALFPCSATSGGPTMREVKDDRQTPGFETLQRARSEQILSVFYNGFLGALSCENSVNTIIERLGRTW